MDLGRDVEAGTSTEEETVVEIENSPSCLKRAFYCLLPACLKNKKTAAEQVIIRVPSQKSLSIMMMCPGNLQHVLLPLLLEEKKASSRTGQYLGLSQL